MFEPEQFYGNIEYKLYISSKKNERIFSQFLFRMREGNGKAIYIIGITDQGKLHIRNRWFTQNLNGPHGPYEHVLRDISPNK